MAEPWLDIRDFPGMSLQAAIDELLADRFPGRKTLYLPRGRFKLTAPLRIARQQGGKYVPCTLEIVGEATALAEGVAAPESRVGTVLFTDFADGPAILIQAAAHVRLRRLAVVGQNNWIDHRLGEGITFDPHDVATHLREELEPFDPMDPDPYIARGVQGNPSSPHAGICIDPLHPSVALDQRYKNPSLRDAYLEGLASAHVLLEDCVISDFVVGVCVAPSGLPLLSQDTPAVTLTNCYLTHNKSCVSVSGDYQVLLRSIQFGTSRHCIDCVGFGGESKRPGRCPSVEGGNIGGVKYVFRTGNTGTCASFHGIYAENTLSLGQLGTPPQKPDEPLDVYTFNGCGWSFINPQDPDKQYKRPSLPSMNAHLFNFAHTTFRGCQFLPNWSGKDTETAGPPLHIVNQGQLALQGCFLGAGHSATRDLGPQFWISGRPEAVWYDNCVVQDVHYIDSKREPYKLHLSTIKAVPSFHKTEYLQSQAIPGSLYYFQDYRTSKEEENFKDTINGMLQPYQPEKRGLRYVAGHWPLIPLGTKAKGDIALGTTMLKDQRGNPVTWPNGKATFQVESGLVLVGDVLVARREVMGQEEENFPGVLVERADTDGGAPLLLGRVISVMPPLGPMVTIQTVEISCMPLSMWKLLAGMAPVSLAIYVAYFPRIHPPTTGDIDALKLNEILNVKTMPLDSGDKSVVSLGTGWGIEHRIFGEGIPLGSYIYNMSADSFRISKRIIPMSFTLAARLYGADLAETDNMPI